jgi:hypothetical protein
MDSTLNRYAGAFGYLSGAIRGIAEHTIGPKRRELLAAVEEAEWYAEHGNLSGLPVDPARLEAARGEKHAAGR